jgi:hypothetical protein
LVLAAVPSARAADAWLVTDVHGAVLALVDGQWRELNSGDRIRSGIAVRTLQAGSAKLRRGGEEIGLAANTVVRPIAVGGRPAIEQYTGVVTLVETGRTPPRVIMPNNGAVGGDGGSAAGAATPPATLYVRGGEAHLSVGERRLLLRAGQGYSSRGVWESGAVPDSDGAPAATSTGAPGAAGADPAPPQTPAGHGAPPGNADPSGPHGGPAATDNGVGNGGTPGDGRQNGKGNAGNGGPGGNGQGGGNGGRGRAAN